MAKLKPLIEELKKNKVYDRKVAEETAFKSWANGKSEYGSIFSNLEKAYNEATTGRKGPVWLDIPLDIQSAQIKPKNSYFDDIIKINISQFGVINPNKQYIIKNRGLPIQNTEKKGNLFSKIISNKFILF